MSKLVASDPLALVAIQAGLVKAPLRDAAAQGESKLDTPQRAAVLGEPVPIVFCGLDDRGGGCLISPPATEARFSNSSTNEVTAKYHLVLSEGQIGSIQVRDVFQRSCRVGSFTQTYNRRAGTWTPGNVIVDRGGSYTKPECPYYCGNVGVYSGMSTLSFENTLPNGSDQWNRQVHCFIRNGMRVPRLISGTTGSSNNFADLVLWSLRNCAHLPDSMIDFPALTTAANFCYTNDLNCNIVIQQSENLADFIAKLAPYFLLAETRNNGQRGLRPLLPLNEDYTINTGAISPVFTFTEDHVEPDGLEIDYASLVDRRPFCAQTIWRQQLVDDFGIIRTSEVRYAGESADGPYEQHDLSAFCTREDHAVKVAAYIRARRKHITHTARINCRPFATETELLPGAIVRVSLQRAISGQDATSHDYLYEINRISRASTGQLTFELTHFPVDADGASLVSLDVDSATPTGIMLESNKTGVGCDINSSSDTSVPAETYTVGTAIDDQVEVTPGTEVVPAASLPRFASLYIYSVTFEGTTLVVRVRIAPTGRAPLEELGDLTATITSSTTVAVDTTGDLIDPQPTGLPTLSFTGTVAHPWTEEYYPDENTAIPPPANRVFQGEFRINYTLGDFPPDGQRYRMPFNITATSGGFDEVTIMNAGIAVFEPDPVLTAPAVAQFVFPNPTAGISSLVPFLRLSDPYVSEARGYGYGFDCGHDFGWPDPLVEPIATELEWIQDGGTDPMQVFSLDLAALRLHYPSASVVGVDIYGSWGGVIDTDPVTITINIYDPAPTPSSSPDQPTTGGTIVATASFTHAISGLWNSRPSPPYPFSTYLEDENLGGDTSLIPFLEKAVTYCGTVLIDITPGAPPELMITTPI